MPLIAILSLPQPGLAGWLEFIRQHPELSRRPSRNIVNPFTNKPQTHTPPPSEVEVIVQGKALGVVVPSSRFEDDRELLVFSASDEDPRLAELADSAARSLNARLEWVGPDHPERGRGQ